MSKASEKLKECVYHAPLVLLSLKKRELIEEANAYLPYTTGFEIECNKLENFDDNDFLTIPDIKYVQTDNCEQRYQVPNGIRGLVCLYNICEQLKISSELNFGAGIHYHIDMRDCYGEINNSKFLEINKDWLLETLDTWEYTGTYNKRLVGQAGGIWFRTNDVQTIEIRVGEMSFDYEVLVKRIVHANQIATKLRECLKLYDETYEHPQIVYEPVDRDKILEYYKVDRSGTENTRAKELQKELDFLLKDGKPTKVKLDDATIKSIVDSRVKSIYD